MSSRVRIVVVGKFLGVVLMLHASMCLASEKEGDAGTEAPKTCVLVQTPEASREPLSKMFGSVELNPSGAAPLTAELPFHPDGPGVLSLSVSCRAVPECPITQRFSFSGKSLRLPILGLYPDEENRVTFLLFDRDGDRRGSHEITVTTGPLPSDFPTVSASGSYDSDALTFVTYFRAQIPNASDSDQNDAADAQSTRKMVPQMTGIMFDKVGRVRWYSNLSYKLFFPMEPIDGVFYGSDWDRDVGLLQWYDVMGRQVGTIDMTEFGFRKAHHDIVKKPNGNLIVTADKIDGDYIGDHVIEVQPTKGTLVNRWDLATVLPDVADLYQDVPMTGARHPGFSNDPVHVNGVAWDPTDDGIIVSSQRSGIAKVYSDGTLAWLLSPHLTRLIDDSDGDGVSDSLADGYDPGNRDSWKGDFTGDDYVHQRMPIAGAPEEGYPFPFHYGKFLLRPVDDRGNPVIDPNVLLGFAETAVFRWPFRPHAPRLMKDGTLLLFDNGLSRGFKEVGEDSFSRAALFEIAPDDDGYGGTVFQKAEFILSGKPAWHRYSRLVSEVDDLGDGTLLICSGGLGSALYADKAMSDYGAGPRGACITQVDAKTGRELHSLLVERHIDEEHPNTPFSVYRSERIDVYGAVILPKGISRLP